jgi:phosphoglycerate dehydrogenase-like enzyme
MKIAVLDAYQGAALRVADWSALAERAEITIFRDRVSGTPDLIERLLPFDIVCVMRERTPLPREVLERLPKLKLIASTGSYNSSIDATAASERGIVVTSTRYRSTPTIELTWALILASARHVVRESGAVRSGLWQTSIGQEMHGKVLGVLGLGNIGREVARIGHAFGMEVVAWSPNMTREIAESAGATLVTKSDLFRQADVLTVHVILSQRTRGLIGSAEIRAMKPTAWLINTSRGPLVDEAALMDALRSRAIAGAALDVFDEEPLPPDHPFRSLDNVLATPHIGYVSEELYRTFYGDIVTGIEAWMDDQADAGHGRA